MFGEYEDDGQEDWIDKALKSGMGFKSDKERDDYIKSLGDPEKHPLFAQTTEDLEGNPLSEAFRCLREEDKTLVELALMYKDEGNGWIQKGDKKSWTEAFQRYQHALTFMDQADQARLDGSEVEADSKVDLKKTRSQILSNRGLASLNLANYGTCRKDCEKAIQLWPMNMKAHYRNAKALMNLKKYPECRTACENGLQVDAENKQLQQMLQQCNIQLTQQTNSKDEAQNRALDQMLKNWRGTWNIAQQSGIKLGYPLYSSPEPVAIRNAWASVDPAISSSSSSSSGSSSDSGNIGGAVKTEDASWPVLLRYPQYGTYDVLVAAEAQTMLVDHLGMAFPEKGDYSQKVEWDVNEEYQASQLVVYVQLDATRAVISELEWYQACLESKILLQGANIDLLSVLAHRYQKLTPPPPPPPSPSLTTTTESHVNVEIEVTTNFEKLKTKVHNREKHFWIESEKREKARSTTTTTNSENKITAPASSSVKFVELHLGCTIQRVVSAASYPDGVGQRLSLPRGVLVLLVFPRENALHKQFASLHQQHIINLPPV